MIRFAAVALLLALPTVANAQIVRHPDAVLYHVYPAGGQRGQTVAVEFGALQGLDGATGVVIDGALGITVKDFKPAGGNKATATFTIAVDAEPGPRMVRVVGGNVGLTSYRLFFVGTMPEVIEKEPNGSPQSAQDVSIPAVVNGRIDPALDIDCFRFQAKAGQRIVAAVFAHGMDSRVRTRATPGYLDTSLELLDERGKILATAEDTLGLDPVIEFTIPAEGKYAVRVQSLGFDGSPSSVYRLTLGEVPYPVAMFPAGAQRGKALDAEFFGINVPANTRRKLTAPDSNFLWQSTGTSLALTDGRDLPYLIGDQPEIIESEPNDTREKANALPIKFPEAGVTVNGRFDKPNDADWYKFTLKKGEGVLIEVAAQRHLRSPIDTQLIVTDSTGKMLVENDDGLVFMGQCEFDFPSSDSRLEFTAPADGDYFVKLTDQSGVTGSRAVYRLTVEPLVPNFRLHQWPDVVPIWGPGSTASFVIQVHRWGGLKGDLDLRIEGLPAGWKGSTSHAAAANYYDPRHGLNQKVLMTITAPADAKVGDHATFRVMGKTTHEGKVIERIAHPQALFGSSHTDRMHLRYSPISRAAVAPPLDCKLETTVKELTVTHGGTVNIPVKITRTPGVTTPLPISVDGETPGVNTAWRISYTPKPDENELQFPLTVGPERKPGTYGIVVSRASAADLRAGRPGPCTEIILLHVKAAKP